MKIRILVATLGLAVLAGAIGRVPGQEPTTASTNGSKAPSRKASAPKAKRKGAGAKAVDTPAGNDETVGESLAPSDPQKPNTEIATFGAGCFWHVEAEFEWLPGVKSAVSGYSGGSLTNPTYEDVHEGWTGHAEVVQVEYDPAVISYEKLLRVFWSGHDPTQLNRQGPDFGTQYRSVIFYHSPEQKQLALKSYEQLVSARAYRAPIVTQLVPMQAFYPAEEYHQNYYGGRDGRRVAIRKPKRASKAAPGKASAKRVKANDGNARQNVSANRPQGSRATPPARDLDSKPKPRNESSDGAGE